jgi:hypothetical protein
VAEGRDVEPEVLDYGIEKSSPLERRDSIEYYREPPTLSSVSGSDVLIWIVSFLVVGFVLLWLIGRWLKDVWT